jgi:predicted NBD/HSP70 family sugar kinase
MLDGDPMAKQIYEDIGVYLGYAIPYYAEFYQIKHLLLLGRVTSGEGGNLIMEKAREVLKAEFPEYADIDITMPDEKNKRVGQSIAAASLAQSKK